MYLSIWMNEYHFVCVKKKSATKLRHDYSSKLQKMVPKIKAKKQWVSC
jgi:hypothetical protein